MEYSNGINSKLMRSFKYTADKDVRGMTPEGEVKKNIKKVLSKYSAYWYMPVSNGMGAPSLDYLVCVKGIFVGIEAKAPGKKATARQKLTMENIEAAGGHGFLCDGNYEELETFLIKIMMLRSIEIGAEESIN
jgi:hypothetical protein